MTEWSPQSSTAAPGWEANAERIDERLRAVTDWLLERADVRAGQVVLDVAAGPGGVGHRAAELVGPQGRVLSTDWAASMVDSAKRIGASRGLSNVQYRVMDAHSMDLEDDAVDVSDVLQTEGAQPESSFRKGSTAPDPDFELLGGGSSSVSEFLGKPLVINFWASTCAPCLAEMPDFESVNQELGGAVGFLGVDVVDTEEAGLEMVEQTGITYPSARDPRGEIFNSFGGTALPRTVILDAEGTVVEAVTGEMEAEELTEALDAAGLLP